MSAPTRILVLGLPGAGKTRFAGELSRQLQIQHVEMDKLFWISEGESVSLEEFRERVAVKLCEPSWIVEGHFTKIEDLVLPKADLVLWLDYPLPLVLFRYLKRQGFRNLGWLARNYRNSLRAFERVASEVSVVRFRHPRKALESLHSFSMRINSPSSSTSLDQ